MLICFVDESGSPPKAGHIHRRYFVIAGVVMHESQWHGIAEEFRKLKARPEYRIKGEIKWRFFGPDNSDKNNSVSHLSTDLKMKFRSEMIDIIVKRKSIKIISCAADFVSAYERGYVNNEDELYHFTYKPVSERFQYHLQDVSKVVGEKQLGIVVADHRGKKQDDLFRSEHHRLVDSQSDFTAKYNNYVETVFLTPSHLSVGIQFADIIAGAIGRALNSKDLTYAKELKPAFRKSPAGKIDGYGFVRFPTKGWGKPSGGGEAP